MISPLETWKKKLLFLQNQEALTADPGIRFQLGEQIQEAEEKIRKLEAQSPSPQTPPPTKNSRLTGTEIGELRGLIMNAFPEEDLAQTLKIHLNLDYNAIQSGGSYGTRVFNLITNYFEPRGETVNLVNSLIKERANDSALKSFYSTHYE
jgi:hypothetical protein